jgi:hypothetical protein
MISFTNEEQRKLYDLKLNRDCDMDFISNKIDLSCYKSSDSLYHLQHEGVEGEFDNFDDMLKEIKIIIY